MARTRRGKRRQDKSARKTAKWIESGGLKKAEAFWDGKTSKPMFYYLGT